MDKLNMSLDQIIKLQKKEKKQMQNKVAQAQKMKGGQQKSANTVVKGFKQFRARVGKKKVAATGGKKGVSPLNRQRRGQNQAFRQVPKKGVKNQQVIAKRALKQATRNLQQKYTQQNRRNQRSQTFNQRRGIPQQNTGIKQRLGFRKGQGQQQQKVKLNRTVGGVGKLRMDMVTRQQTGIQQKRINRQTGIQQSRINRQAGIQQSRINRRTGIQQSRMNRQNSNQQQRQITNQQQSTRKRRWGRTQQNISTNPILQVSVPNKPTKSVSIQLSPNRQQNPQQRRLSNKVFQVQVAQERQQRKQVKQQQPQQSRLVNNMLAQSQRQQQALENHVSHLQAVIANIQRTSPVKRNLNMNRSDFAKRSTGLTLNDRFASSVPEPTVAQMVPQTTFGFGRGRGGRRPRRNQRRNLPQQGAGQRMVFL